MRRVGILASGVLKGPTSTCHPPLYLEEAGNFPFEDVSVGSGSQNAPPLWCHRLFSQPEASFLDGNYVLCTPRPF